jgi:hypothetical protein
MDSDVAELIKNQFLNVVGCGYGNKVKGVIFYACDQDLWRLLRRDWGACVHNPFTRNTQFNSGEVLSFRKLARNRVTDYRGHQWTWISTVGCDPDLASHVRGNLRRLDRSVPLVYVRDYEAQPRAISEFWDASSPPAIRSEFDPEQQMEQPDADPA